MLAGCLQPYGPKRLTAQQALEMPFLADRVFPMNEFDPAPTIVQEGVNEDSDYLTEGIQPHGGAVEYHNIKDESAKDLEMAEQKPMQDETRRRKVHPSKLLQPIKVSLLFLYDVLINE